MGCLAVLGLAVVPLGAFSALRIERMEQTLELMTLTALTPRRLVIGKLLAQCVKLGTLFAGMAPFIAMSFLLGGIDFATILVSLAVLLLTSVWVCAAALFLSSLLRSRAMVGLVLGGAALVLLFVFAIGRVMYVVAFSGGLFASSVPISAGFMGSDPWWALAILTSVCLVTMVNLLLLAENRLALSESRVTPLRVGFLVQFLLIVGWTLSYVNQPPSVRSDAFEVLGVVGGIHLAVVAMFTVTEDLAVPRRVLLGMQSSRWRWLLAMFRPGGGRGAVYILAQMALLLSVAWLFQPTWIEFRWLLAMCGYICVFTGLPAAVVRFRQPAAASSLKLRVAVLLLLPISLLLPDLAYYIVWRPEALSLNYSARHLLNPLRTLANWPRVEANQWLSLPFALGITGLLAYAALIHLGMTTTGQVAPTDPRRAAAEAGEPGSADVLY
jgi:hypothetical protein